MAHFYLGPWVWDVSLPNRPCWRPPDGWSDCVDLRPLAAQAVAGGTPQGFGFFALPARLSATEELTWDYLGQDLSGQLTLGQRQAWRLRLGLSQTPQDGTLRQVLYETLTSLADPAGSALCPPILPDHAGNLRLGGFSRRLAPGDPEWAVVRDRFQRDYRQIRDRALAGQASPGLHRRFLRTLTRKLGLPDADYALFVPADLPDEGSEDPATTWTESFNTADSGTLGPDLTWTEVLSELEVFSNTVCNTSTGGVDCVARAEADVSSADHYGEITATSMVLGNSWVGAACRFAAAATTYYVCYAANVTGNVHTDLYKVVTGAYTQLGTSVGVTLGLPGAVRVDANGSTIRGLYKGTVNHSVTDTAITGNTRGGLDFVGTALRDARGDSFVVSDLAAPKPVAAWARNSHVYLGGLLRC